MIIRTEYANFGKPEDLLRYMQEEKIEVVTVESEYWIKMKKEQRWFYGETLERDVWKRKKQLETACV